MLSLSWFIDLRAGRTRQAINGMFIVAKRDMVLVAPNFIMTNTQKMLPKPSLK